MAKPKFACPFGEVSPRPWRGMRRWVALALMLAGSWTSSVLAEPLETRGALPLGSVIQATLSGNRDILIRGAQLDGTEAAVTQAQGAFDATVTAGMLRNEDRRPANQPERLLLPGLGEQRNSGATAFVGMEKRLQSGIALTGIASSTYADDRISAQQGMPSQTTRKITFGLRVPLARGAGDNFAKATLRAAERERDAATDQKLFSVSLALRDATVAYWEYLSRWRELEIARTGEQRTAGLLEELRKLIAADEIPAAELDLAVANHAERSAAHIAAEQALLEARQALGRLMGLSAEQFATVTKPVTEFPGIEGKEPRIPGTAELVGWAYASRGDWLAAEFQHSALQDRVAAARDLTRPQIDVALNVSSAGLREGVAVNQTGGLFAGTSAGPSVTAQVSIQFPVQNLVAQGQFRQAAAIATESAIRLEALKAEIASTVLIAAADLKRVAQVLQVSGEIVRRYSRTLENERIKRRLGVATLIDEINVEDRYYRALVDDVRRRRDYASGLVRLRHEIGGLVRGAENGFAVHEADFLGIKQPVVEDRRE